MKRSILISIILISTTMSLSAQTASRVVRLYDGAAPSPSTELAEVADSTGRQVAGRSVCRITNVSEPSIEIHKAYSDRPATRSVIIAPGGAYNILAYNLSGTEACKFLNSCGVDAVLLKYRVPRPEGREKHAIALEDMTQAVMMVRDRSEEFGICGECVGVMGFSAGAHLSAMASTNYPSAKLRPDFTILIYPAYLNKEGSLTLSDELRPTTDTPPTFIAQAEDDSAYIDSSFAYGYALKELGVPLTMHIYSNGGHGFGFRDNGTASDRVRHDLEAWLKEMENEK